MKLTESKLRQIVKESIKNIVYKETIDNENLTPSKNIIVKGRIIENTSTNFNFTSDRNKFLIKCHRGVRNREMFAKCGKYFGGGNIWYLKVYKRVNKEWKIVITYMERETKSAIIEDMKNNNIIDGATFFTTVYELENGYDAYKAIFVNLYNEGIKKANEILSRAYNINEFYSECQLMINGKYNSIFNDPDPLRNAAKYAAIQGMKSVASVGLKNAINYFNQHP